MKGKPAQDLSPRPSADRALIDLRDKWCEQVKLAREECREALRALVGRLAHQTRNPLAAIKAACTNLTAEIEAPIHRETLELMVEEVDRILGLLNTELQALTPSSEKPQWVNLTSEVEDVIALFEARKPNTLGIRIEGEDFLPCALPRNSLRVCLYGLFDYLTVTHHNHRVTVRPHRDNDTVKVGIELSEAMSAGPAHRGVEEIHRDSVGIMVAERLVRDVGGQLTQTDIGREKLIALEFPCRDV